MASKEQTIRVATDQGPMGFILFMAWIGAVVYFYLQDQTFWGFVVAIFKGAAWPAFVVYESLKSLGV